MLVGEKSTFGIAWQLTEAYHSMGMRGMGYFNYYIGGLRFGVNSPHATLLGCSFESIRERVRLRGTHHAAFSLNEAKEIAISYRRACFDESAADNLFFGTLAPILCKEIHEANVVMAPDGDLAFNDGSHVLQFDVDNKVRLIAFKSTEIGYTFVQHSLRDVWLSADSFYVILEQCLLDFDREWSAMNKVANTSITVLKVPKKID